MNGFQFTLNFELPRAGELALRIFDAQGKMLHYATAYFEPGKRFIDLEDEQPTGRGVLIYMLEFGGQQRVSRMILNEWIRLLVNTERSVPIRVLTFFICKDCDQVFVFL